MRGRLHEGRTFLERVLVASEKSEASVRAKALSATALLASYQGDYVRAEQLCGEALTLFQHLTVQTAYFLIVLARAASFQHEYARASQLFEESLVLLRTPGYPGDVAWPLLYMAHDLIIQGEHTRARPLLEEGLALCRKADSKGGLAYALSLLGQLAFEQGQPIWAVRLWGASQTMHQGSSISLPQAMRIRDEQAQTMARTTLGEKVFAAAWKEGQSLTPQQALAGHDPTPITRTVAVEPTARHVKRHAPDQLTRREVEVLRLVADGLTDAQVAQRLVLSPGTVSWYLRSICSKLGVSSRTAATRAAIEQHLL